MRRKLSAIEHMIDGNIVYVIRLEGSFQVDRLRSALSRVQRKHPALRTLICKEPDGLYYEENSAPEIPLRIVPRLTEDDYQRECHAELTTTFAYDQPQLRAVWLHSGIVCDLLLTTSHRICDGAGALIIVKEVLRALYSDEELSPYAPILLQDIIGDYQPREIWKRKLQAHLVNGISRLIPSSRRRLDNHVYHLEWKTGRALSDALNQQCKAENVSLHAVLLVALERALVAVLGKKKLPGWIDNPMDIRRGRFGRLKKDRLFFGGGSFKVRAGQAVEMEFWERARAIHKEMRRQLKQELLDIPSRYHFQTMLRPLTRGQIQSIVRLGDALKMNGSWGSVALSNLGEVMVGDSDAPFRVKDIRHYVHSFNFRLLGLFPSVFDEELRFYFASDEKCMSRNQADALKEEFMNLLQQQVRYVDSSAKQSLHVLAAVAR